MKVQYNKQSIDIKFILNIISLLGAVGWGWYEMEGRITALEMKIEQQNKMQAPVSYTHLTLPTILLV